MKLNDNLMIRYRLLWIGIVLCAAAALMLTGCGRDEAPQSQPSATDGAVNFPAATDRVDSNLASAPRPSLATSPTAGPEGIYLTEGGLGYFLIDRDDENALQGDGILMGGDIFRVTQRGGNIIIESRIVNPMFSAPAEERLWGGYMELAPSAAAPGDWDLRRFRHPSELLGAEAVRSIFAPGSEKPIELSEPESWDVPSFLHRVDDARFVEYFEYVADYRDTPEILARAKQFLLAHPDDPWVRILYLDACVRTEEMEEFAGRLAAWKADFDPLVQPEIRGHLQTAERVLVSQRRSAEGRNAMDYILMRVLSPEADLAARTSALPALAGFDFLELPYQSLSAHRESNLLEGQLTAKVLVTQAMLQLLKGRFDEASATMAGVYQWGWLLEQSVSEIAALVGMAIRGLALNGMETLVLNAPLDAEVAGANWADVKALHSFMPGGGGSADREAGMNPPSSFRADIKTDFVVRRSAVEARVANLKVAAALRLLQAQRGTMPASGVVLLENVADWRMPDDAFTSGAVRLAHDAATGALTVYSVGPDGNDDGGAIVYDPTNGTVSGGDIVLRIPLEREFPFPAGGVRAADGVDLWRQFPNGLPRDVFSPSGAPLRATDAAPVRVWSWGPDTNEPGRDSPAFQIRPPQNRPLSIQPGISYIPTVPYDPTNGLVSEGDLFIELPTP